MTADPDQPAARRAGWDAAAALQRARLELAIDTAGIGTFDWDLATGELVWDDRLLALFGYDRESFDASIDAFFARLHPDDVDRVRMVLENAVHTGETFDIEYRVVHPEGTTRWVQARGRNVVDDTGRPARFVGAALDSTDLREGEARVGRLLESMPSAFMSVDRDWRLTYINGEAERMIGHPRQQYLGRLLWEAFPSTGTSEFGTAYRRAAATGTPEVVEGPAPGRPETWFQVRAFPTPDGLSLYLIDATERHLAEELRALESEAGERMAQSLDLEGAVRELARLVVPRLGDWSLVTVIEPDGAARDLASWHVDPRYRDAARRYASTRLDGIGPDAPIVQVRATGKPVVIPSDLTETMRPKLGSPAALRALEELAPESAIVVPLVARGQLVGMLSICRGTRRPPMTDNEIEVAVNLARRAAMALDNARLYARERAATARLQGANERLRRLVAHERTVARALQDAMLTRLPRTETVQLVARYVPANSDVQVGGDWYDAVVLPDGSKALMIGDVVGHDIGAAALMGQLRNLLRGFVWDRDESPAATVVRLDRAIRDLGLGTLATLVLARVAPPEGDRPRLVRWTSAGHPAPVLVAPDGTARFLDQVPDPLLGVLPDSERCDQQVEVPRGATLVLYTDGLVERRDEDLDERRERLLAVLAEHHGKPLDEMLDAVLAEMVGDQRGDDVAVLGARFTPPDC